MSDPRFRTRITSAMFRALPDEQRVAILMGMVDMLRTLYPRLTALEKLDLSAVVAKADALSASALCVQLDDYLTGGGDAVPIPITECLLAALKDD